MHETKQDGLSRAAGQIEMEAFLEQACFIPGQSATPHFLYRLWPVLWKVRYVKRPEVRGEV